MSKKKSIAVDFDGVIHGYSEGWKDGSIYDDPIPGVQEALKLLSDKYEIIIFSTRNHDRVHDGKQEKNQVEEMRDYLKKHDIPFDTIHEEPGKPCAKLFIDDNAYRFEGNWSKAFEEIEKILEKEKDA